MCEDNSTANETLRGSVSVASDDGDDEQHPTNLL
jgi:hypothetical protein